MTMPFYVSPEQLMKDRADYARKGIARGRSVVVLSYDSGIAFVADNPRAPAQDQRDLRPDRLRRGRQVQRVREPARGRRPVRRPARLLLRPRRRHRPRPGERLRPDPRQRLHHRAEAVRGRARPSPRWAPRRPPTRSTGSATTARWRTSTVSSPWAARPSRSSPRSGSAGGEGLSLSEALVLAVELLAPDAERRRPAAPNAPPAELSSRSPSSTGSVRGARSGGSPGPLLERLLSPGDPTSDVPRTDDAAPGHPRHAHRQRRGLHRALAEPPRPAADRR